MACSGGDSVIIIRNRQKKVVCDTARVRADVELILGKLRYSDFDVSLTITHDAGIRKYNNIYRHKDTPTDILSFPFYPNLIAGKRIRAGSEEEKILGDLIISAPYVARAAAELGMSFDERLRVIIVHGICHLLGYDHIDDADYKRMHAKELALLRYLRSHANRSI